MYLSVGDIILFNYDGPIGKWKHAGIVASEIYRKKNCYIEYFKVFECNSPNSCVKEHFVYPNNYKSMIKKQIELFEKLEKYADNKVNKKSFKKQIRIYKSMPNRLKKSKAKIIRWIGDPLYLHKVYKIAMKWCGNVGYVKNVLKICHVILPSLTKLNSQKQKSQFNKKIQKYSENETKSMFCSQFVSAIWTMALKNNEELLHETFPIIPKRCTPTNLEKLPDIAPTYWLHFEFGNLI